MAVDITSYRANAPTSGVSPAGGTAVEQGLASGKKNIGDSYTTFLTLLTAQLKNQDPTAPLDTNAFTQQLVQMTGVQQQLLSNELLQSLVDQNKGASSLEAAGLIGKTVTAEGATAALEGGQARWAYSLPTSASGGATLSVVDASGKAVWSGPAPDVSAGRHAFTWDGRMADGSAAPEGAYTLKATAFAADGSPLKATLYVTGKVSAALSGENGVRVQLGPTRVELASIVEVSA